MLNPGNHKVEAFGTMEVRPEENTVYTLDVQNGQEKCTKKARVYLYEDVMEDYLTAEPEVYYRGSKLSVYYRIQNKKGAVDLIAGGAPVELQAGEKPEDKITVSFVSAEKIAFSYKKRKWKRCVIWSLVPMKSR